MNYPLTSEKQRKKFNEVIDYLKDTGNSQREIAKNIGLNSYEISKLRSGQKNITAEIIETLRIEYNINPYYITYGASNMFDIIDFKYKNFDSFIDSWDLVEHGIKNFLYFTMDKNFYDFLINIHRFKEESPKTDDTFKLAEAFEKTLKERKDKKKNKLKLSPSSVHFSSERELYLFISNILNQLNNSSNTNDNTSFKSAFDNALESFKKTYHMPDPQKYILIPIDDAFDIAEEHNSRKKKLDEVVTLLNTFNTSSEDMSL